MRIMVVIEGGVLQNVLMDVETKHDEVILVDHDRDAEDDQIVVPYEHCRVTRETFDAELAKIEGR